MSFLSYRDLGRLQTDLFHRYRVDCILKNEGRPCIATPHAFFSYLSTETEFLDDISVSLDIDFLEVVKNTTSLADQLQKRKTCYMVFLVVLQMLGKVSDTVGKQSNLTLRRAGVLIRLSVLRENLLLLFSL